MKGPCHTPAIIATLILVGASLAGCGAAANVSTPVHTSSSTPSNTVPAATSTPQPSINLSVQHVALTVLPGAKLGPDGKKHDTFSPADLQVIQGVPVELTVYNYDGGAHSITSSELGLNVQVPGNSKNGQPSVTKASFTPGKTGTFVWQCMIACDGEANGWAMANDGYMQGKITVIPPINEQDMYITIKDGLQIASADGKLHDSFSPADFTLQQGIPARITVFNYDEGQHSLTAPDLNLSEVFDSAGKDGAPSVKTFTLMPDKAGQFTWHCVIPCDGGPTGWAMSHDGYMSGTINVVH